MDMQIDTAFAVAEWKSWKKQVKTVKEELALWNNNLKTLPSFQHGHCRLMIASLQHELDGLLK